MATAAKATRAAEVAKASKAVRVAEEAKEEGTANSVAGADGRRSLRKFEREISENQFTLKNVKR